MIIVWNIKKTSKKKSSKYCHINLSHIYIYISVSLLFYSLKKIKSNQNCDIEYSFQYFYAQKCNRFTENI